MVCSMTGFGRAKDTVSGLDITVEIKSVNHRFFEFSSRVPRAYQFLDEKLKTFCGKSIVRGKAEVSVTVADNTQSGTVVEIDRGLVDAYMKALGRLAREYRIKNDVKVSSLMSVPGIFKVTQNTADDETVTAAVLQVANSALDSFIKMRTAEGERLADDVKKRTDLILEKVTFIEERSPKTVKEYRERIEQKIRELIGDTAVDEQRLITETAVFADKVAVDEETVRLRSHISQLCALLDKGGAVGRKLDFIVQEMNREANTIGSKAQDIEIAHTVVDIKAEIEKIREQIQNIE